MCQVRVRALPSCAQADPKQLRKEAKALGITVDGRRRKVSVSSHGHFQEFAYGVQEPPQPRSLEQAFELAKGSAAELERCAGDMLFWTRAACESFLKDNSIAFKKRSTVTDLQARCAAFKWSCAFPKQPDCKAPAPAAQEARQSKAASGPTPELDKLRRMGSDVPAPALDQQEATDKKGPPSRQPGTAKTAAASGEEDPSQPQRSSAPEAQGKTTLKRKKQPVLEDVTNKMFRDDQTVQKLASSSREQKNEIPADCSCILPRILLVKMREAAQVHHDSIDKLHGFASGQPILRGKYKKKYVVQSLFVADPECERNDAEYESWVAANAELGVVGRRRASLRVCQFCCPVEESTISGHIFHCRGMCHLYVCVRIRVGEVAGEWGVETMKQ